MSLLLIGWLASWLVVSVLLFLVSFYSWFVRSKIQSPYLALVDISLTCMCVCEAISVVSDSLRPCGLQPIRLLCPWGFSRQEYWTTLPYLPPGDLPDPGIEPMSPLQADSWPLSHQGSPDTLLTSLLINSSHLLCYFIRIFILLSFEEAGYLFCRVSHLLYFADMSLGCCLTCFSVSCVSCTVVGLIGLF